MLWYSKRKKYGATGDMDIKKRVNDVMAKPVDRREFLAKAGAVALAVVGISSVLRALEIESRKSNGYGSSAYGGDAARGKRL